MPSGSHDELPPVEIVPGYSSRMADWGGMTVAFEKAHAGQDASAKITQGISCCLMRAKAPGT